MRNIDKIICVVFLLGVGFFFGYHIGQIQVFREYKAGYEDMGKRIDERTVDYEKMTADYKRDMGKKKPFKLLLESPLHNTIMEVTDPYRAREMLEKDGWTLRSQEWVDNFEDEMRTKWEEK